MTDPHLSEDEAVLYVLDELDLADRREFEARLEKSPELRAAVRELESGAVALAVATSQREPPPHVWQGIEAIVADELKRKVVAPLWPAWMRHGWAAAAGLLGFLLCLLWMNRSGSTLEPPSVATQHFTQPKSAETVVSVTEDASPLPAVDARVPQPPPDLRARGQIATLRRQVGELESELARLSQVVTQQQALLSQPGQFRFFRLVPAGFEGDTETAAPLPSAALQRAFLAALARELGWLQTSTNRDDSALEANPFGVDFVDLLPSDEGELRYASSYNPPENSMPVQPRVEPSADDVADTGEPPSATDAPGTDLALADNSDAILGFVSENDVVLAIDPAAFSAGAPLGIWSGTDQFVLHGTVALGSNPMIVTFSASAGSQIGVSDGTQFYNLTNIAAPVLLQNPNPLTP